MPVYEFRCKACGRKVTLTYKTVADYSAATPACTYCQSTDLSRLISRVAIKRSSISRLMSSGGDNMDALGDMDENDPRALGRMMREMGDEMGEDMGGEFDEVVSRLERGDSPEDIEASLPPDGGDLSGGGMPFSDD